MNLVFKNQDVEISWCGGGLLVEAAKSTIVLDCPPGVEHFLPCGGTGVDAVVLTSGRPQSVGGLVGLLCAASHFNRGSRSLSVYACAGEERGPALVECWQRFWRGGLDVLLDVNVPGRTIQIGEIEVLVQGLVHGEPDWSSNSVVPAIGVSVSLRIGATQVVWVPGAAPHPGIGRLCRGVDLAIIEVGVASWPKTEKSWRLTYEEAVTHGSGAEYVWLVDDEGRRVTAARA
jgi:hypothetical protein